MEQYKTPKEAFRHGNGFAIRTYGFALLCGLFVILMRGGAIQSTLTVDFANGILFSLSDFFVILAGGICGYRYGMATFATIFIWELFYTSQTNG